MNRYKLAYNAGIEAAKAGNPFCPLKGMLRRHRWWEGYQEETKNSLRRWLEERAAARAVERTRSPEGQNHG